MRLQRNAINSCISFNWEMFLSFWPPVFIGSGLRRHFLHGRKLILPPSPPPPSPPRSASSHPTWWFKAHRRPLQHPQHLQHPIGIEIESDPSSNQIENWTFECNWSDRNPESGIRNPCNLLVRIDVWHSRRPVMSRRELRRHWLVSMAALSNPPITALAPAAGYLLLHFSFFSLFLSPFLLLLLIEIRPIWIDGSAFFGYFFGWGVAGDGAWRGRSVPHWKLNSSGASASATTLSCNSSNNNNSSNNHHGIGGVCGGGGLRERIFCGLKSLKSCQECNTTQEEEEEEEELEEEKEEMRRLRPAIIFLPTTSSPRSLHCRHQIIGQIIRPLTNPTSATVNVAPCVPANRGPPTRGPPTAVQRHRIPANQSWELQCNSPGAAQGLDRVRQPTAMENDWAGCWTPPFTPKKKQERREEGGVGCEASLSLTWREPPPPRPSPRCWPMYPPFLPLPPPSSPSSSSTGVYVLCVFK